MVSGWITNLESCITFFSVTQIYKHDILIYLFPLISLSAIYLFLSNQNREMKCIVNPIRAICSRNTSLLGFECQIPSFLFFFRKAEKVSLNCWSSND